MLADDPKKTENKDDLEKLLKDYKKDISSLKDRQSRIIIEGKLNDQLED